MRGSKERISFWKLMQSIFLFFVGLQKKAGGFPQDAVVKIRNKKRTVLFKIKDLLKRNFLQIKT